MEKPKRPRTRNGYKPEKRFKALYPEYLGFNPDSHVVFEKTAKGYVCQINSGAWMGFPRHIIENNKHLFKEII